MSICTAHSKRTGLPCTRPAMHGSTKCYHHGGASLKGIAAPNYQGKGFSRHLPALMKDLYDESYHDPELLSTRKDAALLDARIAVLLSRVDTGEAGKAWKDARGSFADLQEAFANRDAGKISRALTDLDSVLGRGLSDYTAWNELQSCLDQRRRLVESERKRLIEAQQVVTVEESMLLVSALLESVRRVVTDRKQLSAVQDEFIRLTNKRKVLEEVNDG